MAPSVVMKCWVLFPRVRSCGVPRVQLEELPAGLSLSVLAGVQC